MGFFFSQHEREAKRGGKRGGVRKAPETKQNAATLNRLGCAACPLNNADVHTPKMKPTLGAEGGLYFLGEAPGENEDQVSGVPLTGPSGKLLRSCIPTGEERYCTFDNVVRDRPEKNRRPTWNEIECCREHVTKSVEKVKPSLIVGLGTTTLSWALGSTDMMGMRGRIFAMKIGTHTCNFMPVYHPSYILRSAYNKDKPLNSKMGHAFRLDIRRAFELLASLPPATVDTEADARAGVQGFDGSGGYTTLVDLLNRASKAPIKAIDIETSGLRPFIENPRILTCAISFDDVNFSFAIDHPKALWTEAQKNKLLFALHAIIRDKTKKIAHNAPFEIEWFIKYFGTQCVNHLAWECTMMQAHFLDERRGQRGDDEQYKAPYQNLNFLVKQHFGLAYKNLFKLNKKDMAGADLAEMLIYNAVDTKYTLKLWHLQKAALKRDGLWKAYQDALPRQAAVAVMQHLGIDVDQSEVKAIQSELETDIKGINADISNLKVIKKYCVDHGSFNPMSTDECITVFKDYLHRPEIVVKADTHTAQDEKKSAAAKRAWDHASKKERYSVDKNVLDQIDHPLAGLIIELRNRSKLKSTYADQFELGKGEYIYPDGKIHTSFNTTFTETGRTSSDEPNMQNFPKRNDAWVRKIIKPPKNHIFLAFDYGQLEGCTAAMCSRDKVLVKALWEQYDIHMEWTEKLVKRYPLWLGGGESLTDKKTAKRYRSVVKNKLVFPAIFGASNDSIASYLKIPDDVADDLMDEFWGTFTGLKRWQDGVMKTFYDTGYVASPTGRWHRYPLNRNQVINFPVQGVASDIVCDSMSALSEYAIMTNQLELHPVLNIHDDLTFVVPDSPREIDKAVDTIYRVMLDPPYDFINVPMSVEVSKGHNWFEMEEIGKFRSDKDL